MIIVGDRNIDLERMVGRVQDKDIAEVLSTEGMEDIMGHFLP